MGRIIRGIIGFIIVCLIIFCSTMEVKAEKVIEIKIPDEIKLNRDCDGDFSDFTEKSEKLPLHHEGESYGSELDDIALQKIAVAEAGNTNSITMCYIMQTVLNRVESDQFPNSVSEVIKQKGQFSTYPKQYNKAEPTKESKEALDMLKMLENQNQLYFENTVPGSWQSTNLSYVFEISGLTFYK